jgi:L-threonylcarbamoyladenylate synthase
MPLLDGARADAVEQAAQALLRGELVAMPTETVYGLAARADDDAAVGAIFRLKGRPPDHPLIVHVADRAGAQAFAAVLTPSAERLIDRHWPGPVTVIVRRAEGRGTSAAAGLPTIGLRCPSHPVARTLLARCAALGMPGLAAPSANRFGAVSPTTAAHVAAEFGDALLVLDGGACELGIESTIVDCSKRRPVLLRPGVLTRAELERALGESVVDVGAEDEATPAPGTLESHYAPKATLRLMETQQLGRALSVLPASMTGLAVYSRSAPRRHRWVRTMPDDPKAVARELYAVLREFDAAGVKLIWVERPPDTPEWEGVTDRLQRAAAP